MQERGLNEYKAFTGSLEAGGQSTPLSFSACILHTGEVEFDFGYIAVTKETSFIMTWWDDDRTKVSHFTLKGVSEDAIKFSTKDLHFTSLSHESSGEHGSRMRPIGGCSRAEFRSNLAELAQRPLLRMRVKGFQNFRKLHAQCPLGTVAMDGEGSLNDHDTMTGYIAVQSDTAPNNLHLWRMEADKLLEHIRRLMSFASATVLQAPITEFFADDGLEVVALSQSRQAPAVLPTFHHLHLQPIFDTTVKSFFDPPFPVKNLFFAIEWFSMDATYSEVRLVNAMTVLENLVVSNLTDQDALIRRPKEFEKTRKALRQVIKKCVKKWPEDTEQGREVVDELNERLTDLNRRSLLRKVKTLAERWSVPLVGISDDKIKAAKRARDLIVHQGQYYVDGQEDRGDLWGHVIVVREIVVRFLLTAIGYKGGYISYLGGYHFAQFPPPAEKLHLNGLVEDSPNSEEH